MSTRHRITDAWLALPKPRPRHADAAALIGCTKTVLETSLSRCRKEGYLTEDTRSNRIDRELVLEEWEFLREAGEFWERAARRLGVAPGTLLEILADARSRGDRRGFLTLDEAVSHQEES